ncbi:hypothetical protein ACKWTF_012519 [Chironomus riparius]
MLQFNEINDFFDKCRCCLKNIDQNKQSIIITNTIRQQFYDLTQISLDLSSANYSQNLCEGCSNNLQIFTNWRQEFITNQIFLDDLQQKAINEENQITDFSQEIQVKVEPLDVLHEINEDDFDDFFQELPFKNEIIKPTEIHSCKYCSLKFSDTKLLENHWVNKHKAHLTSSEVRDIRKRRIDDRKLVCPECGIRTHYIKNHMERMHLKVKRFFCDHCDHSSFHKSELEFHMMKHKDPIFVCDYCSHKFRRKMALKIHIRRIHLRIRDEKKYNRNLLPKSQRKGVGDEDTVRIQCQHCDKDFLRSYIKSHIEQVHTLSTTGEKCTVCNKIFKNKRALLYHKRNHKEKVFKCDYPNCDKAYFIETRLNYHRSVHKNIRVFKCLYEGCDKSYFIKRVLNMHIALFHEKYTLNCPVELCKFSVGRKDYMRNHMNKQHKDLPSDILSYYSEQVKEMPLW